MLHEMGIETGIDIDALIECARYAKAITKEIFPAIFSVQEK